MGDDKTWTSYANRDEWKDVQPIYHDDLEKAVVNIAYSQRFAEIFAYFRALLSANEVSERAFQLTTDAVKQNPANYTVWQFRRQLIKQLNKDLMEELEFCADIIVENPKNYQVWYHRSVLVELVNKGEQELGFTSVILGMDAKNYHAWQHRFQLFENEMAFCNLLLAEDLRNNSAWNYRYFVIKSTSDFTADVLKQELRILLDKLVEYPEVQEFCETLYKDSVPERRPSSLIVFILDFLEERLEKKASPDAQADVVRMEQLCNELVRIDPIRKEYWNFLKRGYSSRFASA